MMRVRLSFLFAVLAALPALAVPVIRHDPVASAIKGQPLGIRAFVRDPVARVTEVALYYASSRGMTPMRAALTASGAGAWYGSIPGHLVGPGDTLVYYIQAENADGETAETDWVNVRLASEGPAPEDIASSAAAASEASRRALPPAQNKPEARRAAPTVPAPEKKEESTFRQWAVPAAIVAGGAVVVGGAVAIAGSGGGGGDGGSSTNAPEGTYSGNYTLTFNGSTAATNEAAADAAAPEGSGSAKTRSALASAYFEDGNVKLVGLWGGTTLSGSCPSRTFTISSSVPAYDGWPASHLVVAGAVSGKKCTLTISGYPTETGTTGEISGNATLTSP
jgi:hypothetical protein